MSQTNRLTRSEAAEMTGISVRVMDEYRRRGTFPAPDGYMSRSPWWRRKTIERWMTTRRTRT